MHNSDTSLSDAGVFCFCHIVTVNGNVPSFLMVQLESFKPSSTFPCSCLLSWPGTRKGNTMMVPGFHKDNALQCCSAALSINTSRPNALQLREDQHQLHFRAEIALML